MAQYVLLNVVRVGTQTHYPGEVFDTVNFDVAPLIAVGGQLVPASAQALAWAAQISTLRRSGQGADGIPDPGYPLSLVPPGSLAAPTTVSSGTDPLTQSDWYVDWINGNDANDGTIAHPVKTVMGGIVTKWGTPDPTLRQTTTLHILSSQPGQVEKISLHPRMLNGNFGIIGTPQLSANITLGTVTAKGRTQAAPVLKAAGFTGHTAGQLVINTTVGKASHALILSVDGTGVATLMQPLTHLTMGVAQNYNPVPAEVDTWAPGDTVSIYNLPTINIIDLVFYGSEADISGTSGAALWLDTLLIPDPSGTPAASFFAPRYDGGNLDMQDVWCVPALITSWDTSNQFLNTWAQYGWLFHNTQFIGGAISNFGGQFLGINWLDGDVILDAGSAVSGLLYCGYVAIDNSGYIIEHPGSSMEIRQLNYANGKVYGPGAPGTGVALQPNSICTRRSPTVSWTACLDVANLFMGTATVGSAYSGGVLVDNIALTSANLDTYHGLMSAQGSRFVEDLGTPPAITTSALFGGTGTSAPLTVDWTTPTTPTIKSGANVTSLTIGTNRSGATAQLTAGANVLVATLSAAGIGLASGMGIGFYGTAPGAKPTITGSRGGNAALASLLTALAAMGLITDSTTA